MATKTAIVANCLTHRKQYGQSVMNVLSLRLRAAGWMLPIPISGRLANHVFSLMIMLENVFHQQQLRLSTLVKTDFLLAAYLGLKLAASNLMPYLWRAWRPRGGPVRVHQIARLSGHSGVV